MKNKLKIILSNRIILIIILFLATILRLFHLNQVPFTHDEFSALFRTQYDTFNELIQYGVIGDGHPAGIQVFLFYLVKLFGFNNFWIKLPFVIFGILSVWFTYKIAKEWFNETVGLISATFIATLQFSVIYSQIARPYISGLFFSLLMIHFLSKYLFKSQKRIDINLVGFITGAILCSFNHYFSLLLAIITGIVGLFFVNKKRTLHYIGSGIIIFLFFIPHLKITFSALEIKGLSWLGKPDIFFFSNYIKFIFNNSIFIGIIILSLITLSYFYPNKDKAKRKFQFISLILLILPVIIGFIYSVMVKPVLQYSVLIFSFPFLIILLSSYLKEFNPKINFLIVSGIILITCSSLIFEKKHYTVFYQSGFYEALKENSKYIQQYSKEQEITTILASNRNITRYYLETNPSIYNNQTTQNIISKLDSTNYYYTFGWNNSDSIYDFYDKQTIESYKKFLANQKSDYLFYGWAHNFDKKLLSIIPNYYPYLIYKKGFFNSEVYLFSKHKTKDTLNLPILFSSLNDFEKENQYWSKPEKISDSISYSGEYSCYISKDTEYSSTFQTRLKSVLNNNSENIQISLKFYSPNNNYNALLVFSIENNNKKACWHSVKLNDFINKNKEWQTANLIIQIDKTHFPWNKKVKAFIWNLKHEEFFIDDFLVKVYPGNKNRYSY